MFSHDFSSLHLGLTYVCSLKCPECCRTTTPKERILEIASVLHLNWKKYQSLLDYFIRKNFGQSKEITLCGNWGEPTNYPWLIELCSYIKAADPNINIELHTNGSYNNDDFWMSLSKVLNAQDLVVFAIDGTWETTQNYRLNSNTKFIKKAIELMRIEGKAKLQHKTLLFKYNDELIEEIYAQSKELKMNQLKLCWPWQSEENTPNWKTSLDMAEVIRRLSHHPADRIEMHRESPPWINFFHAN